MTKKIAIENSREMVEKLKEIRIEDYTYDLPDERIAKFPLENREASKLLIYDEGRIDERHFYEVPEMLDAGKMLVFNNTKVIYARILFQKVTGAVIEVFCLEPYTSFCPFTTTLRIVSGLPCRGSIFVNCLQPVTSIFSIDRSLKYGMSSSFSMAMVSLRFREFRT